MATMAPSMPEVISLMRSLLRTAAKFPDYNIREYTRRRVIDAFRENRAITDASSIAVAFAEGKSQLEVAKRQAVVYSLYAPKIKSVMEIESL
ncbi:LYR motif-containing protein 4B [Dioscorea cayenensis subsp. rotundata]|uniref:LYR motif-containing protein 4B n=1 Tax=Dioscorea cayennensis subsp. rotundata TaxID=55577 RepID=A0AB40APY7_DIOCR|nr:LYR motif-containing protein 4B [Dioscorea cayenensis subsp. rotundata]